MCASAVRSTPKLGIPATTGGYGAGALLSSFREDNRPEAVRELGARYGGCSGLLYRGYLNPECESYRRFAHSIAHVRWCLSSCSKVRPGWQALAHAAASSLYR